MLPCKSEVCSCIQTYRSHNLPPLKNSPCTNSSTPSSSRPTPTRRTLLASSRGFRVLSCLAPRRQKGHPNRRRKVMTTGCFSQRLSMATFCNFGGKRIKLKINMILRQTDPPVSNTLTVKKLHSRSHWLLTLILHTMTL